MKKSYRVIFLGTPEFSVPALQALHEHDQQVVLVVTRPDRPRGRGRKVTPSPVKTAALNFGYPVTQPSSLRNQEAVDQMKKLEPDFLVVTAYGQLLPEDVLKIPRLGAINVHASILPKYRGPAPIQWAIINAEKETGITTMLMDTGMDTGDILLTAKEPIRPDDTAATLHHRLAHLGAALLIETLESYADNRIQPVPQNHSRATRAPMLAKEDGHIDWNQPVEKLEPFIRGVTPWPGAFTFHGNKRLKIFKAKTLSVTVNATPGTVLSTFPDELRIAAGSGALSILEIQGESGKRMAIKDFLRGYELPAGTILN